jgi:16S rRNA G966 N2-methylase RsmD
LTGGFSIVFLDPSYDEPDLDRMVELAASQAAPGGVLVVEHTRRRSLPAEAGWLVRTREVKSGDSLLSFYRSSHGQEGREGQEKAPGST